MKIKIKDLKRIISETVEKQSSMNEKETIKNVSSVTKEDVETMLDSSGIVSGRKVNPVGVKKAIDGLMAMGADRTMAELVTDSYAQYCIGPSSIFTNELEDNIETLLAAIGS